jgi:hypothetical protein
MSNMIPEQVLLDWIGQEADRNFYGDELCLFVDKLKAEIQSGRLSTAQPAGGDAIKSVTNCPTCGGECTVEGKTTHYYVPAPRPTHDAAGMGMPDWLLEIAHKLKTQDNRITSEPLFCVFQKRRIYGIDSDWADDSVWVSITDDGLHEVDEQEVVLDEFDEPTDSAYKKLYYVDVDVFVNAHLTDEAAKLYIKQNHYNLKRPFTYVTSQYRCHEYIQLRNWIMSLPSTTESGEQKDG